MSAEYRQGFCYRNDLVPVRLASLNLDHLKRFHCESIVAEEQVSQEYHWSEAHLIRELEKNKIGRPSTYTNILESIKEKKYVELGKKHGQTVLLFLSKENTSLFYKGCWGFQKLFLYLPSCYLV